MVLRIPARQKFCFITVTSSNKILYLRSHPVPNCLQWRSLDEEEHLKPQYWSTFKIMWSCYSACVHARNVAVKFHHWEVFTTTIDNVMRLLCRIANRYHASSVKLWQVKWNAYSVFSSVVCVVCLGHNTASHNDEWNRNQTVEGSDTISTTHISSQ